MGNIFGTMLCAFFIFFGTLDAFAKGEWYQGEVRFRKFETEILKVKFDAIKDYVCMVSIDLKNADDSFKSGTVYVFERDKPKNEIISIDGKERNLFFICAEGQLAFFIDEERLTGK